jgi:hypothetical protein
MGSCRSGGKSGTCLPLWISGEKNHNLKEEEMDLTLI